GDDHIAGDVRHLKPRSRGSISCGAQMPNITCYVVVTFVRNEQGEGELIAEAPAQMPSATAATSRTRSLASTKAGVVAFARTGSRSRRVCRCGRSVQGR